MPANLPAYLRQAAKDILENRFKKLRTAEQAEFNRHIKTVCKLTSITERVKRTYTKNNKKIDEVKPICEWITTHACRRSFSTNEFLAGTSVELVMKIIGPKSTKDFYRYIRNYARAGSFEGEGDMGGKNKRG